MNRGYAERAETRQTRRRLSHGAEVTPEGTHFRVWAPGHRSVELVLAGATTPIALGQEEGQEEGQEAGKETQEPRQRRDSAGDSAGDQRSDGFWSTLVEGLGAGARYGYRLDGEELVLPDPASRAQPDGPHGLSQVVDSRLFRWTDLGWTGLPLHGQIIYELHIGTFTPQGTWAAAVERLDDLRDLGITVVEVMPVAEFPGRFGWGYDGVGWFAPYSQYGTPDDFRRFVDAAHFRGLGVILDVVYNHLGPDGNYLERFSPHYFSTESTEWGRAVNFDGKGAAAVRALVTDNAVHWIDEYHLDGLRLDATQTLLDRSPEHIVAAIGARTRAAAGGRRLLIIAENEPQDANLLRSTAHGGCGLDALWNDDFHHSAMVALTGRRQAYYSDYSGQMGELLSIVKHGFAFQGQWSAWQKKHRGQSTRGLPPAAFVAFLENHDQVANSMWSSRVWQETSPGRARALTALLLLGPWTPLLFQGQEWNASTPFHYFADHNPELARLVRAGRRQFMSQFPGCVGAGGELLADPGAAEVFQASRLAWNERLLPGHARALALHRDLLRLRRSDATLSAHAATGVALEVATLGPHCGVLRYFVDGPVAAAGPRDRLLVINLGADLELPATTEPLLAPPGGPGHVSHLCWRMIWSSEDTRFGGHGSAEPEQEERGWRLPGEATVLLAPIATV
jgi:maltooligosyltrehalose trehalohydrolase